MTYKQEYKTALQELVQKASPEVLAICKVWHGEHFGEPGWGGVEFVAMALRRAQQAVDAPAKRGGMNVATQTSPNVRNAKAGRKIASDYNKQFGRPCEDCGERSGERRRRCNRCRRLVCRWCFHHVHSHPANRPPGATP